MTDELKPCPFCGGEAKLHPVILPMEADCDSISIQCVDCDAWLSPVLVDQELHSISDLADLEAEAIAAWNTRATDAAYVKAAQAMAEALEACEELLSDSGFYGGRTYNIATTALTAFRAASATPPEPPVFEYKTREKKGQSND